MNNEENLFNIEAISVVTKKRWLRTQELYSILSNIGTSNLINLIVEKLPFQPQAGEIFILNGNSINKKWKNDGHTYLTRKNGIGFREDIEKLKIGGTKEIICYYSHIIKPYSPGSNSQVVLNRRIYKLIRNNDLNNNYFFVHYLKDTNNNNNNNITTVINSEKIEDPNKYQKIQPFTPSITAETWSEKKNDFLEIEPDIDGQNFFEEDSLDEIFQRHQLDTNQFIIPENPFQNNQEDSIINYNDIFRENNNFESKQKEENQFQLLQNKIHELETKIQTLEFEKHNISNSNHQTNSTVSNSIHTIHEIIRIKINDFSPEWDFEQGGSKFMLCFLPNIIIPNENENKLLICFGDINVKSTCIQPGVIKCFVPNHVSGIVKIKILYNGEFINENNENEAIFEFKKAQNLKRKKPDKSNELFLDKDQTKKVSQDFKIRIIEKLSAIHQNLTVFNTLNNSKNLQSAWEKEDINQLLEIFKNDVENFDSKIFIKIFALILKKNKMVENNSSDLSSLLDTLDEDGFALIHYLTLINFYDSIPFLVKYKANLNILSKTGVTPLQIAIAFNYEKAVEMFIKHGVINSQNIDTIINESQKNKANQNISNLDVLFKNSHILDMLMREVTLHDSINNSSSIHTDKFSWNQQDDQEDENYINFLEMMDDMDQKLVIHSDDDEKNSVRKVSTGKEKIIETKSNIKNNFKHKYLKTNKKKNTEKDKNLNQKEYMSNYKEIYDIHQDHIKIIQKNVRGWLLRRQYLDIKYAARVLQNYIRGKLAKKQISPEYKILIKNKLKDWLNIKC